MHPLKVTALVLTGALMFSMPLSIKAGHEGMGHGTGFHGGGHYHGHNGRGLRRAIPFFYGYGYPYYDSGPYWYYCSDPTGFYPEIQQCFMPWQPVPGG